MVITSEPFVYELVCENKFSFKSLIADLDIQRVGCENFRQFLKIINKSN